MFTERSSDYGTEQTLSGVDNDKVAKIVHPYIDTRVLKSRIDSYNLGPESRWLFFARMEYNSSSSIVSSEIKTKQMGLHGFLYAEHRVRKNWFLRKRM